MQVELAKTEHCPAGAFPIVPLFPELRPYLEAAWDAAEPGAVYVVPERFRRGALKAEAWKAANPRTTFDKIVERADVKAWPKLFQNRRPDRETELVEQFRVHLATWWLRNTPKVADPHYLRREAASVKTRGKLTHRR